jgi:hypothetical protein
MSEMYSYRDSDDELQMNFLRSVHGVDDFVTGNVEDESENEAEREFDKYEDEMWLRTYLGEFAEVDSDIDLNTENMISQDHQPSTD